MKNHYRFRRDVACYCSWNKKLFYVIHGFIPVIHPVSFFTALVLVYFCHNIDHHYKRKIKQKDDAIK